MLNVISMKVKSQKEKLSTIDIRVTEVENSCSFVNEKYETQNTDIQNTRVTNKAVQDQCKQ